MVSKKNLMEIVKKLMVHMDKAEGTTYRDELLSKIIQICSQNNYQYITNFEWYVSVLVELTRMEGSQHGPLVASQMLDVATRVQAIRQFAVEQMAVLIENAHLLTAQSSTMSQVLYAAAWITGEFSQYLRDPQATLEAMLRGRVIALPGHIQAAYVQNILKLFSAIFNRAEDEKDKEKINKLCDLIAENLPQFVSSADLEVQERASSAMQLIKYVQKQVNKGEERLAVELETLFVGELNPVAPKAQKKVQIPEGLDLNEWINDPPTESSDNDDDDIQLAGVGATDIFLRSDRLGDGMYSSNSRKQVELTEDELEKRRIARRLEQANNPHYLKASNGHKTNSAIDDYSEVAIAAIDLPVPLKIPGLASSDNYLNLDRSSAKRRKRRRRKKEKKGRSSDEEEVEIEEEEDIAPLHVVNTDIGEMPEGAQLSDGEELDSRPNDDPHKALDINLDEPLRDEEKLPILKHRTRSKDKVKKSKTKIMEHQSEPKTKLENKSTLILRLQFQDGDIAPKLQSRRKKDMRNSKEKKKKTQVKYKEGYEEAAGISTPSKEVVDDDDDDEDGNEVPVVLAPPPMTNYKKLADDKNMQMLYETKLFTHEPEKLALSVLFTNKTRSNIIELDFSVCDTPSVSMVKENRDNQYGNKLPFILDCRASSEMDFIFHVTDITSPHKVRGTLTYMVRCQDGSGTETSHHKLDFLLYLPCSTFMIGVLHQNYDVTNLLEDGQLTKHKSLVISSNPFQDFTQVIVQLCYHCHFSLLQRMEKTASLYSHSARGHHVLLLVKLLKGGRLGFEGRSDSEPIISNLFTEIEVLFQPKDA
ncbi:hypothetical protein L9F63_021064 [Diploptera punctata]|uniref:AP-3 complex subunit delta domain-containing protein n=1 Tax=Diploptera punctata TaxID=6984 RepID=A0AAD8ECB0_DIPPU|nr:hypothetical protein L9F63_021064 [Diploptera punctata]